MSVSVCVWSGRKGGREREREGGTMINRYIKEELQL